MMALPKRSQMAPRIRSVTRQLDRDFVALAARFSGPEFHDLRRSWVNGLLASQLAAPDRAARQTAYRNSRLALIVDPENAYAHNGAAWALVSFPDDPWFEPKEGLKLAKKALDLDSKNWAFWNTLGVAAFRTGDWATAHDSLRKSIGFTGGKAHDWFFVAMTHWNQGNRDEAHECFAAALAAMKNERKDDPELLQFHAEAAALMGLDRPKTEIGMARTFPRTEETAQQ